MTSSDPQGDLDRDSVQVRGAITEATRALDFAKRNKNNVAVSIGLYNLMLLLERGKFSTRPGHQPFLKDEPVFIIRGRDARALHVLREFQANHVYVIEPEVLERFQQWQAQHPDLMISPD